MTTHTDEPGCNCRGCTAGRLAAQKPMMADSMANGLDYAVAQARVEQLEGENRALRVAVGLLAAELPGATIAGDIEKAIAYGRRTVARVAELEAALRDMFDLAKRNGLASDNDDENPPACRKARAALAKGSP